MSKAKIRTILMVAAWVFLLVGALQVSTANADTRTTTKKTKVYKQRGESSDVILQVPARVAVKVLTEDGRWVKVRYKGRTGWMTRTSLTATSNARSKDRTVRKRPFVEGRDKRRGWASNAPEDRIGADAIDEGDGESTVSDEGDEGDEGDEEVDDTEARPVKRSAKRSNSDEPLDEEELLEEDEPAKASKRTATRTKKVKPSPADDDDADDADDDDSADADDDDSDDADDDDDDEDAKPRKKKPSRANVVLVTASEAGIYTKKSRNSESVATVEEGAELTVLARSDSGRWIKVRDSSGGEGWILARQVSSPSFEYSKRTIRADARLGYSNLSQQFRSQGAGGLNYDISAPAAAISIGGELLYRYSPRYMVGVDLGYNGSALSKIRQMNVDTSFSTHEVNLGILGGYNLENPQGMVAYGRIGYHYDYFGIKDVATLATNPTKVPSEIFQGLTFGARFDAPYIKEKMGFSVGVNALLLLANRKQTNMLDDGTPTGNFAAWFGGTFVYRWKPNLDIEAGYRLTYAKSSWNGGGARQPAGVTSTSRRDLGHLLSVGVGRSF